MEVKMTQCQPDMTRGGIDIDLERVADQAGNVMDALPSRHKPGI
jgi:hypothetical protein